MGPADQRGRAASLDYEYESRGAAKAGDEVSLVLEVLAAYSTQLLDSDLRLLSLGLDSPQADELAVLEHCAWARDRPEQPFAQDGVGGEKRPVGLLQIKITRWNQTDPSAPGGDSRSSRSSLAIHAVRLPTEISQRLPSTRCQSG